ncbi:MAG: iron-containing alcohol dehydrogenase [Faecalibacterium sp.]|nr:iron-containing alcohol dehydrogenase [Ruminococcus sp.]MCM1392321.1 iron-containing alcohol dehydrogenase [Ruminococcus sp.]MCM1486054.1 iron-containing alcohol dehydrogenase [Faecalibacterium sp.]
MDFNLSIPVKVISGKDCVRKNSDKFADFGNKCIIVTGGKSALMSGALNDVKAALDDVKIEYTVFSEIGPNPLLESCHKAGEIARNFGAQFVVGIGGGSPLDAAKATAVFAANETFSPNDVYAITKRNRALPLVLIGTTAGTGSEVGRVSVLTSGETGRKRSIAPDDCNPSLTFADSTYTHSMPYSVTVSTALDALSHALEGYFSIKCSDIPTMFAEKAIPMIWGGLKYLDKTKSLPDENLREQLYFGSLYAGITLAYCGTAFPHPLGYILTENYGTPHGMACAAFMPAFIERAEKFESDKFNKLMSLIGENKDSFCRTIKNLTELGEIKMTESEIENYCSRWNNVTPNNFKFSPGGYTKDDAQKLIAELFFNYVHR